jgi:hypothetical protein
MNPDGIKYLLEICGAFGLGAILSGIFKSLISSYLSTKGMNLANKEDIKEITDKVEAVRLEYSSLLEAVKSNNQLRMAAIDKRLQAHQEAFSLWSEMMKELNSEAFPELHTKCSKWWNSNCLYLEPEVKTEFLNFITNANIRYNLITKKVGYEQAYELYEKLEDLPITIFSAIKFPAISTSEMKAIKDNIK